uniref:Integrase core domain containing protein n=1 Tax=Solanum tuberosum TaxID=4113 RepID=M1D9Z2_SOLTU
MFGEIEKEIGMIRVPIGENMRVIRISMCHHMTGQRPRSEMLIRKVFGLKICLKKPQQGRRFRQGVLYDILVKLDKFIFFDDFVVLDCEIDVKSLIILDKPFLATKRALVDDESGELKFRVNNKEVNFNVCKSMKHPCNMHIVSYVDVIDDDVASVSEITCHGESLAVVLLNYDGEEICDYDEVVVALVGSGSFPSNPKKLVIDFKNRKSPSIEEPPRLKLKALPSHLRYVVLGVPNPGKVQLPNGDSGITTQFGNYQLEGDEVRHESLQSEAPILPTTPLSVARLPSGSEVTLLPQKVPIDVLETIGVSPGEDPESSPIIQKGRDEILSPTQRTSVCPIHTKVM